jgi:S1-C subfamily serine protease
VVTDVAKRAMPAVVSVHTSGTVVMRFRDPFYDMFYGPQRRQFSGWGSGVIIDKSGIVITNDHVVRTSGQIGDIDVNLPDGRKFRAKVRRAFPDQDLAVLEINGKDLPYLQIAPSRDVSPGQTVLAIGNPFGDALNGGLSYSEPTITRGIISATKRNLDVPVEGGGTRYLRNMLQTDASINPGNSGGALINLRGELIGVNTAIYSENGNSVGIGFAIPSDRVRLILEYVRAGKDIGTGYTGIWVQDLTEKVSQSLRFTEQGGSLVTKVESGSPGDKSELKRGDIITRVNGFNIGNSEQLVSMFLGAVPGEAFILSVYREGKTFDTELKLESK